MLRSRGGTIEVLGRGKHVASAVPAVPRRTSTLDAAIWRITYSTYRFQSALKSGPAAASRLPPSRSSFSNNTTLWPREEATSAASMPAGPPPTTTTFFFSAANLGSER